MNHFVHVPRSQLLSAARSLPSKEEFSEMAVPSYCHRLGIIRWLFRKRLETTLRLAQLQPGETALDFGTGSGILLPSLAAICSRIYAADPFTGSARALVAMRRISNVAFINIPSRDSPSRVHEGIDRPVDCAFALDVLEHIEDLQAALGSLASSLTTGGRLIVSGPTETLLYKAGRLVAGYRQEHHVRNIFDIRRAAVAANWALEARAFEPFFPLPRAFEIYRLRRTPSTLTFGQ
jgi:SAM-dependent methyltransferase